MQDEKKTPPPEQLRKIRRRQSVPIFLVLFLGYIGFSLILPIFAPMLFNPEHGLLPSYHNESTRSIVLGLLISMYPLGQFFGCPLLGRLSDIYGRRKILLISLALIAPFYIISGIAVSTVHISLLFISRLLIGLCEGNIVIATAAIADISENHLAKVKNFGWITAVSSSGFIFGPLVGGKLADPSLVSWFSYATPFYFSAIFVAIAWLTVYFLFVETKPAHLRAHFHPLKEIKGLYQALNYKKLRKIFFGNFNLYMAFFFFFAFLPVLLVRKHNFGPSLLAEVESYLAICICLSPLLYKKISKHLNPKQATALAGALFFVSESLLLLFQQGRVLVFTLLLPGFCIAMGFTYTNLMISDNASKERQGTALGTNQAILVLSEFLSGLLGGFLAGVFPSLPLIAGALLALLSAFWLHFKVSYHAPS